MKRARLTIPLLALSALLVALALTTSPPVARGQTGIIVEGAKQVRTEGTSYGGIPGGVPVRVVLESAQTMRQEAVTAPPAALRNQFALVPVRVVLESAQTMRYVSVSTPPQELLARFAEVPLRVILESAQTVRQERLAYPVAFFNDKTGPAITEVRTRADADGIRVLWRTNEFSTSEVHYGYAPGVYDTQVFDGFYVKEHGVLLRGLTPGRTFYFAVSSVDRSGNRSTLGEYQGKTENRTYLPLLLK